LSVAADGVVPAWYQLADVNAADTRAYLAYPHPAQEQLPFADGLVVGDSMLISRPNMLGFGRAKARFVGPTSPTEADRQTVRTLWAKGGAWQRLDGTTDGEADGTGRYWGMETRGVLPDPEQNIIYLLQRFFIQRLDDRRAAWHKRAKDPAKAHREVVRKMSLECRCEQVARQLAGASKSHRRWTKGPRSATTLPGWALACRPPMLNESLTRNEPRLIPPGLHREGFP